MKARPLLLVLLLLPVICNGQGAIGSWTDHLSYSASFCLAYGDNKIFSSAGNSLLINDLQYDATEKMTRLNGLTETEISTIAWSENEECLIIAYSSTNIDVVKNRVITNIPDIKRKYIGGVKEINLIRTNDRYAYLACSFGIVILDLKNSVISDTWKPGADSESNEVFDITFFDGNIYAATASGVYYAPVDRIGLSYFDNWEKINSLSSVSSGFSCIATCEEFVYAGCNDESTGEATIYKLDNQGNVTLFYSEDNAGLKSIEAASSTITVTMAHSVLLFSPEGNKTRSITSYSWGSTPDSQHALTVDGKTWIADKSVGMVVTSDYTTFSNILLEGPYTNDVADIYIVDGKKYVTGGSVTGSWGNVYRPFQLFTLEGEHWHNIMLYGSADKDAMRVVTDPENSNHGFVSSWGNGIYEFLDGELINNYNESNSPLLSAISGEPYSRVCGLAYDDDNNLWVTHSGMAGNLKMLKSDGTWVVTNVNLNVPTIGDMLIGSNGFIWVVLPRGHGLLVYDPSGTPENTDDDNYITLQVEDSEGTVMTNIYSIAEDLEGNIWVGTDAGPVVYYTPEKAFTPGVKASRIKVPRNDGSGLADYLLNTETITTIAIDGANRKWFGTMSSGAYLVSEDGMTQIHKFTTDNSPLYSDQVVKIAVDGSNGEVWIGTSSGMLSYRSDATEGKNDYSDMYTFPNPVREDFGGVVTIAGLVESSTVKITDINGNLVYEAVSNGGVVTWDLINYRGKHVSTGVYLVFAANSDGTLSGVTKMLIIR